MVARVDCLLHFFDRVARHGVPAAGVITVSRHGLDDLYGPVLDVDWTAPALAQDTTPLAGLTVLGLPAAPVPGAGGRSGSGPAGLAVADAADTLRLAWATGGSTASGAAAAASGPLGAWTMADGGSDEAVTGIGAVEDDAWLWWQHPEALVALLVTDRLGPHDVVVVLGAARLALTAGGGRQLVGLGPAPTVGGVAEVDSLHRLPSVLVVADRVPLSASAAGAGYADGNGTGDNLPAIPALLRFGLKAAVACSLDDVYLSRRCDVVSAALPHAAGWGPRHVLLALLLHWMAAAKAGRALAVTGAALTAAGLAATDVAALARFARAEGALPLPWGLPAGRSRPASVGELWTAVMAVATAAVSGNGAPLTSSRGAVGAGAGVAGDEAEAVGRSLLLVVARSLAVETWGGGAARIPRRLQQAAMPALALAAPADFSDPGAAPRTPPRRSDADPLPLAAVQAPFLVPAPPVPPRLGAQGQDAPYPYAVVAAARATVSSPSAPLRPSPQLRGPIREPVVSPAHVMRAALNSPSHALFNMKPAVAAAPPQ